MAHKMHFEWIIRKTYLDEGNNLQFGGEFLEKITEKETATQNSNSNNTIIRKKTEILKEQPKDF